jgi:colicin import membrane protein
MSFLSLERVDAASPGMLALSVSVHFVLFVAIFTLSLTSVGRSIPQAEGVSKVSLIEEPGLRPLREVMARGPVKMKEKEEVVETTTAESAPVASESPREVSEHRMSDLTTKEIIPLAKRKKQPQRVESPKPQPVKKPDQQTAQKKSDSKEFLEQRLAALKQDVDARRSEQHSAAQQRQSITGTAGSGDGRQGVNQELLRWFQDVRGRVNSNWSVFGDNRTAERFAIIGVRLSDDGRLIDATVDETSGDPLFDRSAMRAVFQASPFPPVPPEIRERIRQAGGLALRFSPGGMQ